MCDMKHMLEKIHICRESCWTQAGPDWVTQGRRFGKCLLVMMHWRGVACVPGWADTGAQPKGGLEESMQGSWKGSSVSQGQDRKVPRLRGHEACRDIGVTISGTTCWNQQRRAPPILIRRWRSWEKTSLVQSCGSRWSRWTQSHHWWHACYSWVLRPLVSLQPTLGTRFKAASAKVAQLSGSGSCSQEDKLPTQ